LILELIDNRNILCVYNILSFRFVLIGLELDVNGAMYELVFVLGSTH